MEKSAKVAEAAETINKPKMSTASLMIWAMVVGIFVGLFFGERVGWMSQIGSAIILLMQMTIYPYILVSLVGGIGKLDATNAKKLFSRAGLVLLGTTVLGVIFIFCAPLMFPQLESGSFFSTSVVEAAPEINYLKLYIPSNPFESLSDGAVPAIVIFSIALGVALISIERKQNLMDILDTTTRGLSLITQSLVKILPIGIFAMSASAAGTITVDEFASLQVFLASYIVICLFLTFWVLPFLVNVFAPIKGKEVTQLARTALITGFSTGNIFITLPTLIEACKIALENNGKLRKDSASMVDIILPVVFTFPNLGKATILLFVLFAGWFVGKPVELSQYPITAFSGVMTLFGSVYAAIPFLLNQLQLPTDLFQLFVVSSFITGKFNSMVAVMHLLVTTLLAVLIIQRDTSYRLVAFVRFFAVSLVILALLVGGTRWALNAFLPDTDSAALLTGRHNKGEAPQYVIDAIPRNFERIGDSDGTLATIRARGVLRVGYVPNNVPFTFYNRFDELVGFDVDVANRLAADIGVAIEFVPLERDNLIKVVEADYVDVVMSGLAMDVNTIEKLSYTQPVLQMHMAFVVPDFRVSEFKTVEQIKAAPNVIIAFAEHDRAIERAKARVGDNIHFQAIDTYEEFFEPQNRGQFDLLLTSAEAGYAWTLINPDFSVLIPEGTGTKYPSGYAVKPGHEELRQYLNNWLTITQSSGFIGEVYDAWILGKGAKDQGPRWNIYDDVLGWGKPSSDSSD